MGLQKKTLTAQKEEVYNRVDKVRSSGWGIDNSGIPSTRLKYFTVEFLKNKTGNTDVIDAIGQMVAIRKFARYVFIFSVDYFI